MSCDQPRTAAAGDGKKDTRDSSHLSRAASTAHTPSPAPAAPARGQRTRADHQAVADRLRLQPDEWGVVGIYSYLHSANTIASGIRRAGHRFWMYGPARSFQTRTTPTDDGYVRVEARFVSSSPEPPTDSDTPP
ncbi:hypothetical protein [Streptomyces aureocirculatus]|nr:hypothetical protein [Streptomyces aureocirculatus]